jgi:hypothetical protein
LRKFGENAGTQAAALEDHRARAREGLLSGLQSDHRTVGSSHNGLFRPTAAKSTSGIKSAANKANGSGGSGPLFCLTDAMLETTRR